jgi:hypothetical protein
LKTDETSVLATGPTCGTWKRFSSFSNSFQVVTSPSESHSLSPFLSALKHFAVSSRPLLSAHSPCCQLEPFAVSSRPLLQVTRTNPKACPPRLPDVCLFVAFRRSQVPSDRFLSGSDGRFASIELAGSTNAEVHPTSNIQPQSSILNPQPSTLNPQPSILQLQTSNLKIPTSRYNATLGCGDVDIGDINVAVMGGYRKNTCVPRFWYKQTSGCLGIDLRFPLASLSAALSRCGSYAGSPPANLRGERGPDLILFFGSLSLCRDHAVCRLLVGTSHRRFG